MSHALKNKTIYAAISIAVLASCRLSIAKQDDFDFLSEPAYFFVSDQEASILRSPTDLKMLRALKSVEKYIISAENPHDLSNFYVTLADAAHENADVNIKTDNDLSPLLATIFGGNVGLVKFFLNKGADTQMLTREGLSPLMIAIGLYYAAHEGYLEPLKEKAENYYKIIKALLKKGAALHLTNSKAEVEKSVLAVLTNKNQEELIGAIKTQKLFDLDTLASFLFLTVRMSYISGFLSIVNLGTLNINAQDGNGDTSLHMAVKYGNKKMVRALLDKKADVYTIENNDGLTVHDTAEIFSPDLLMLLEGKEDVISAINITLPTTAISAHQDL